MLCLWTVGLLDRHVYVRYSEYILKFSVYGRSA